MYKTLRGAGTIDISNQIGNSLGKRVTADFLNLLLKNFAKQSKKYINVTSDPPYAYRERQIHSIMAPALATFTNGFLMECPVDRKWSKMRNLRARDSKGWVDYWCHYRNLVFLIEVKHDFVSAKSMNLKKTLIEKWRYMNNEQLRVIKDDAKYYSRDCKGVFLIPLHILTVYHKAKRTGKENAHKERVESDKLMKTTLKSLHNPKPNWCGVWNIHRQLCEDSKYEAGESDVYCPAVVLVSHVGEIVRSRKIT